MEMEKSPTNPGMEKLPDFPEVLRSAMELYIESGDQHLSKKDRIARAYQEVGEIRGETINGMIEAWGMEVFVTRVFDMMPDKAERQEYLTQIAQFLSHDRKAQLGNAYRSERDSRNG